MRKEASPSKTIWTRLLRVAGLDLRMPPERTRLAAVDEADGVAELFDLVHAVGGEEDGAALLAEVDERVHAGAWR